MQHPPTSPPPPSLCGQKRRYSSDADLSDDEVDETKTSNSNVISENSADTVFSEAETLLRTALLEFLEDSHATTHVPIEDFVCSAIDSIEDVLGEGTAHNNELFQSWIERRLSNDVHVSVNPYNSLKVYVSLNRNVPMAVTANS